LMPGKNIKAQLSMNNKVKGMGQNVQMDVQYYINMLLINNLPNSTTEWQVMVDSMVMTGMQNDEEIYVNSNQPETMTDEKMSELAATVGKKMNILISESGEISAKDTAEKVPEFAKYAFMYIAPKNQKVGYTWQQQQDAETMGIKINTNSSYKIEAIKNKEITVIATSIIENKMMKVDPTITTYKVDAETMLVKSATSATKMSMMKLMKLDIKIDYKAAL
jgi:hypothetical protein